MIAVTVPIAISREAAERVQQLGLQQELEQMTEHACQAIPTLVRLEVSYTFNEMFAPEDPVELNAVMRTVDINEHLKIMDDWNSWVQSSFPTQTRLYFTLITTTESGDAV